MTQSQVTCVHEHNAQRLSRHAKIMLLPNDTPR